MSDASQQPQSSVPGAAGEAGAGSGARSGSGETPASSRPVAPASIPAPSAGTESYDLLVEPAAAKLPPLLSDEEEEKLHQQAARLERKAAPPAQAAKGSWWSTSPFSPKSDRERIGRSRHATDSVDAPIEVVFVKPGLGEAQPIAIAGAAAGAIAAILGAILTWNAGWKVGIASAIWGGYLTLLHAGTGAVAVAVAATLHGRPLGSPLLAAARMLLAVGLFMLGLGLAPFLTVNYTAWLGVLLAFGGYAAATMVLFRLPIREWFMVACIHLFFVLVVLGTVQLHWLSRPGVAVVEVPSQSTPAPTPRVSVPEPVPVPVPLVVPSTPSESASPGTGVRPAGTR